MPIVTGIATAADATRVSPPLGVLLALVLALGVSSLTYRLLVWRSTTHRRWVALMEWGRECGFRFRPPGIARPPAPLDGLAGLNARAEVCLADARTAVVLLRTDPPRDNVATAPDGTTYADPAVAGSAAAADPAPSAARGDGTPAEPGTDGTGDRAAAMRPVTPPHHTTADPHRPAWHVLVRRLEASWRPTGARPAHAPASLLDLFSLSSFPLLANPERFVIYGTDSAAARALSRSSTRALLPADIGLLLHGHFLLLDFSGRPFDAIEFNRMRALADQLVAHLPAPE